MSSTSSTVAANTKLKAEAHPSEKTYVKIAVILAVLTAAEVATYPAEDTLGSAIVPILLVLMVIKFWYVAAFFMHLKFDTKMFSSVFVAGLVASSAVYIGTLTSMERWHWLF